KESNETKKTEKIDSATQLVKDLGISIDDSGLREEIQRRIDEGRSAENIAAYLQDLLVKQDPEYAYIIAYPQLKETYSKALDAFKGAGAGSNTQEYKDARKYEYEEAKSKYDQTYQIISKMGDA